MMKTKLLIHEDETNAKQPACNTGASTPSNPVIIRRVTYTTQPWWHLDKGPLRLPHSLHCLSPPRLGHTLCRSLWGKLSIAHEGSNVQRCKGRQEHTRATLAMTPPLTLKQATWMRNQTQRRMSDQQLYSDVKGLAQQAINLQYPTVGAAMGKEPKRPYYYLPPNIKKEMKAAKLKKKLPPLVYLCGYLRLLAEPLDPTFPLAANLWHLADVTQDAAFLPWDNV